MAEDIRAVLDLKETPSAPVESKPKRSGFAVASLILIVTALVFLVAAVPVTLADTAKAGDIAACLIIAGFGFGVLALLVLVVAVLHIACSGGKRRGYEWVGFSVGLMVLAALVFFVVAQQWGDRYFKIW